MAFSTFDVLINKADGWVLVATNPVSLVVKPGDGKPWFWSIGPGTPPAAGVVGVPMGRGEDLREALQVANITGTVYVRVDFESEKLRFGVARDQA